MGAEAIKKLLQEIDLDEMVRDKEQVKPPVDRTRFERCAG